MAATNEDGHLRLLNLCTKESWWRVPHLVKLNLLLLVPFFSSYVGGFDGSMLNGIQTVTQWQECQSKFHHAVCMGCGLTTAVQISIILAAPCLVSWSTCKSSVAQSPYLSLLGVRIGSDAVFPFSSAPLPSLSVQ